MRMQRKWILTLLLAFSVGGALAGDAQAAGWRKFGGPARRHYGRPVAWGAYGHGPLFRPRPHAYYYGYYSPYSYGPPPPAYYGGYYSPYCYGYGPSFSFYYSRSRPRFFHHRGYYRRW